MKWCYNLRNSFKKSKPLIDTKHNIEIEKLNILIYKYKYSIEEYEKQINELRCKIIDITKKNIIKNIFLCKTNINCKHESCDITPIISNIKNDIVKEYTHQLNYKDEQIKKSQFLINELNDSIQTEIYNLNIQIDWYKENYQKLQNNNIFLVNSLEYYKKNIYVQKIY